MCQAFALLIDNFWCVCGKKFGQGVAKDSPEFPVPLYAADDKAKNSTN